MVDSLTASKLTMESFARNRARLALVGCPGATEWLNVVPATRMGTKMSSAEFLVALKRWVGQPTTAESQQCPQCADHRADEYGDHALQCASGGCKYRRHNDLRDMLYKAAQGVGLQPVLEPSHLCTDEKRPADFLTIEGDAKMCNDIFVIHPFAAAHITATIEEPGSATEKYAENIKHANFKKLHIAESHGFRALGVDTFGGWNAEGRDFISALAKSDAARHNSGIKEASRCLYRRLNFSIIRHCARAILLRAPQTKSHPREQPVIDSDNSKGQKLTQSTPAAQQNQSTMRGRHQGVMNQTESSFFSQPPLTCAPSQTNLSHTAEAYSCITNNTTPLHHTVSISLPNPHWHTDQIGRRESQPIPSPLDSQGDPRGMINVLAPPSLDPCMTTRTQERERERAMRSEKRTTARKAGGH